jgi:hypothetical protein
MIILQQYFFYATGHENTFTNIRWEVVFHGFDGNSSNILVRLISIIFLLLSTFSSYVIIALYLIKMVKKISGCGKKPGIKESNISKIVMILKYIFIISLKVYESKI